MSPSFDVAWARHEARLRAAWVRAPQLWSLERIRERVRDGDGVYFWPGERSAIVGEVMPGDLRSAFNFWLGAGDRAELFDMARRIEAWARARGCTVFLVQGRRGWARYASAQGYRRMADLYVKETP